MIKIRLSDRHGFRQSAKHEAHCRRRFGEKMFLLLEFAGEKGDIADPWYTGNFEDTYRDVRRGCEGLLEHLLKEEEV